MNFLLIIGLALFACIIVWIYLLFMASSIKGAEVQAPEVDDEDNVVAHCER